MAEGEEQPDQFQSLDHESSSEEDHQQLEETYEEAELEESQGIAAVSDTDEERDEELKLEESQDIAVVSEAHEEQDDGAELEESQVMAAIFAPHVGNPSKLEIDIMDSPAIILAENIIDSHVIQAPGKKIKTNCHGISPPHLDNPSKEEIEIIDDTPVIRKPEKRRKQNYDNISASRSDNSSNEEIKIIDNTPVIRKPAKRRRPKSYLDDISKREIGVIDYPLIQRLRKRRRSNSHNGSPSHLDNRSNQVIEIIDTPAIRKAGKREKACPHEQGEAVDKEEEHGFMTSKFGTNVKWSASADIIQEIDATNTNYDLHMGDDMCKTVQLNYGGRMFDYARKQETSDRVDVDVHHLAESSPQRKLRNEDYWDPSPSDFNMCIKQAQMWMRRAGIMYEGKEQALGQAAMHLQDLTNQLHQRDAVISFLEKRRNEERAKWQQVFWQCECKYRSMANLLRDHKRALSETRKAFSDYRLEKEEQEKSKYRAMEETKKFL